MRTLHRTLAILLLAVPALAQQPAAASGPTSEQIKAAAEACKAGLKAKSPAERIAAIEAAARVDADEVAKEIADGLRDKDDSVDLAAMKALGAMHAEGALKELHRLAKSADRKLQDNAKVYGSLLRAIGQHGDKSSIEVLASDPTANIDAGVVRARIYGLGNIRDKESVETLIKLMSLGNPTPGEDSPFMPDMRVALARLTGTDQTTNKSMWQEWWNKNKKEFQVAELPVRLEPELQQKWDSYWGNDVAALPGERGRDGTDGGKGQDGGPGKPGGHG